MKYRVGCEYWLQDNNEVIAVTLLKVNKETVVVKPKFENLRVVSKKKIIPKGEENVSD